MRFYADMGFFEHSNIIVGIDETDGKIIFSHCFQTETEKARILEEERRYFPSMEENPQALEPVFSTLSGYAAGETIDPTGCDVKFSRGTPFQKKVWTALKGTRKGECITYGELANRAGSPNAQQAVGQTMGKNYLLIFVPCHRVIAAGNKIGGFSAGIQNKRYLLRLEGNEL
jgi:methylated-DNA-[protein]-cysteine S-methyltransferase